jgi:formyltetrahydrofolate deformylase
MAPAEPGEDLVNTPHVARKCVLRLSCADRPGIVYAVAGYLVAQGCTITQSQQFEDRDSRSFFMRVEFDHVDGEPLDLPQLRQAFEPIAEDFTMSWQLADADARPRVVIMVSKYGHCLNDLLYRTSVRDLNIDVVAVVSNHPDLGLMADNYGIPFRHIPATPETKAAAEHELLELVRAEDIDLVVLARYMQILSNDLTKQLEGRAINIHHSMLPSFKGARPYHQAYARGVKVVGATAHYVTADLDEGPIIEQEILRVDHAMTADEFVAHGREAECRALARAVRWHTENRVMLNGDKTVVFE